MSRFKVRRAAALIHRAPLSHCKHGRPRRRAPLVLFAALVAAVAMLTVSAGSASAYEPQYYTEAAYATGVTSLALASGSYTGASVEAGMNPGGTYAAASQAGAIRAALLNARWASAVMPAAETLGAIALGTMAFDIGWKIGRTIDTKWLHMYNLTTGEFGYAVTDGHIRDANPWEWAWNSGAGEWRLRTYSDFGWPCGDLDVFPSGAAGMTLVDLYGPDRSTCKAFLQDAYDSLTTVVGTLGLTTTVSCPGSFFGSSYTGSAGTCYRIVVSKDAMRDYLASKVDNSSDYSGQTPTVATSNYNPSYSAHGFASQAAQTAAFTDTMSAATSDSPGEFADYALNPSGTVSNPLIDFAMPDCWGLSVSDCENAITEVADAVGQTVSFSVVTAPAENSDVARDLILSTFPAASSMARPAEVTLTKNSSSASQKTCKTETDKPHPSEHNPTMQTQGRVRCNYTGESSYQMWMWECSSTQTSDPGELFDDVLGGAFGCGLRETTSGVVEVVAMSLLQSGGSEIRCPNIVEQSQPYVDWGPGFWIGASVTTNPSPVENYPPLVSATGVQYDDPEW